MSKIVKAENLFNNSDRIAGYTEVIEIGFLEQLITQQIENEFQIEQVNPVLGGDINQAYQLIGQSQAFFVKVNHSSTYAMFEAEKHSLELIASQQVIKTPDVIALGRSANSYLVLEWLDLKPQGDIKLFAQRLSKMHQVFALQFGLDSDNFIGITPQRNQFSHDWLTFFLRNRIQFQFERLRRKYPNEFTEDKGTKLNKKIAERFAGYVPKPSLVHGDLWQGNYRYLSNGEPVLFDPSCYFGDREVDLAMLTLFGDPGAQFFESYHQFFAIEQGFQNRKPVYDLYHMLNHANLFGDQYLSDSRRIIEQLLLT